MINKLNIQTEAIYAVGDIHGCFSSILSMIKRYEITNSTIVICGDCGLGFYGKEATKNALSKLNTLCKKSNVYLVMVRGNHDDPAFFNNGTINTKNIIAVPDYTVLNDTILLVGGAISIDRNYRKAEKLRAVSAYLKWHQGATEAEAMEHTNNLYWVDEAPVFNQDAFKEIADEGISIRHICTHTCPSFCDPQSKDGIAEWGKLDETLFADIDYERHVMDLIWDELKVYNHPLESWTYGHYHRHSTMTVDDVKFTMLGAVLRDGMYPDWIELKNISSESYEN